MIMKVYDDAAITNISIGIMNEKKQIDIIVKDLLYKINMNTHYFLNYFPYKIYYILYKIMDQKIALCKVKEIFINIYYL